MLNNKYVLHWRNELYALCYFMNLGVKKSGTGKLFDDRFSAHDFFLHRTFRLVISHSMIAFRTKTFLRRPMLKKYARFFVVVGITSCPRASAE